MKLKFNNTSITVPLILIFLGCANAPPIPGEKPNPKPPLPVLYFENLNPYGEAQEMPTYEGTLKVYANNKSERPGDAIPGFLKEEPLVGSQKIVLRIRGQSSKSMDKKTFLLKVVDSKDWEKEIKIMLPGVGKESEFILSSPWFDATVLPNYLAAKLSRQVGMPAPKVKLVEVYGSQLESVLETQYQGIYVLTEKIKRGQSWIDVKSQKDALDISGGYILKLDKESPGDEWITTNSGQRVIFDYPKSKDLGPEQKIYIQNYINSFEGRVKNPTAGVSESFGEYIDLDTFADIFLIYEALGNQDGLKYSSYMTKDRGKLKAGPVWDHDLSMGQSKAGSESEIWEPKGPDGWTVTHSWVISKSKGHPFWWKLMIQDAGFFNRLKNRWQVLKAKAFNMNNINSLIDEALKDLGVTWDPMTQSGSWGHLEDDNAMFPISERWGRRTAWPAMVVWEKEDRNFFELNYEWLRTYISTRLEWMDQESTWVALKQWSERPSP